MIYEVLLFVLLTSLPLSCAIEDLTLYLGEVITSDSSLPIQTVLWLILTVSLLLHLVIASLILRPLTNFQNKMESMVRNIAEDVSELRRDVKQLTSEVKVQHHRASQPSQTLEEIVSNQEQESGATDLSHLTTEESRSINSKPSEVIPTTESSHVTSDILSTEAGNESSDETPIIEKSVSASESIKEFEAEVNSPSAPLLQLVEVVTGEEGEEIMFQKRAKLFRYSRDFKEWKERGLGEAKILLNSSSGRTRFLMRREETLTVCANHRILPDMRLEMKDPRTRFWAAQDFTYEELRLETFSIRFKTEEEAIEFEEKFNDAVLMSGSSESQTLTADTELSPEEETDDDIHFEPEEVETRSGEEEETVLFRHRAKLYRFTEGEWKERGLGDIKVLRQEKTGRVRLLMRREQVLKVCLNHDLTKDLLALFKKKDEKTWTWAAQDFSDGKESLMTLAVRFKTPEISAEFRAALDEALQHSEGSQLSFAGQGLRLSTAEEAREVCQGILNQKRLHSLTLSGNSLGVEAAEAIGQALESCTDLRRADWRDLFTGRLKSEIPPALISLTGGLLGARVRLVELDLSDNALGSVGMEGLETFLRSSSCLSLQVLRLNNTGLGVAGGKMLASLLYSSHLTLRVFSLGGNRLEDEGALAMAEVFRMMGSLEEVEMPQNGIYHEGLSTLAESLACNPNLRILNLNDNTFNTEAAMALAAALRKLTRLEVLDLGDCLLRSEGTKFICRALTNNHPALRRLVLDSNEITVEAGPDIVEAVKDKPDLIELSIDFNQFGASGLEMILDCLEDAGKRDIVGGTENNEEPGSEDEEENDEVEEEDLFFKPAKQGTQGTQNSSLFPFSSSDIANRKQQEDNTTAAKKSSGFSFTLPFNFNFSGANTETNKVK